MADIIPNQSLGAMSARNLSSGLGEGLQALAQHKIKEIQRGKKIQSYQKTFNVSPQDAESLAMLEESSPNTFHHLVSQLGGGTQPGQQLEEGQEPQFNRFVPGGNKQEAKEDRQKVIDFEKNFNKNFTAQTKLGKLAEHTLKTLNEVEKARQLPTLTRNFNQKNIPWASDKVRNLQRLYGELVGELTTAKAAETGFKAAGTLAKLVEGGKSALDQPYETQREALQEIIDQKNETQGIERTLLDLKKKNNGRLPVDIIDRLAEMELEKAKQSKEEQQMLVAQEEELEKEELPDPKLYKEGDRLKESEDAPWKYIKKNGKWELIK